MPSYEETAGNLTETITNDLAGTVSGETLDAITAIISGASGGDSEAGVSVQQFDGTAPVAQGTTVVNATVDITADPGAGQVIIMESDTKADVTFAADSTVQAIVVGGAGGSNVTFEGDKDVTVQLQGGENDNVNTGAGNDAITFNGGSATIDTGEGDDSINLMGEGTTVVNSGSGNSTFNLGSGTGVTATIDAGDGFDLLQLISTRVSHVFSFINGFFQMHSDNPITMSNVNVVGFDNSGDGILDQTTVLASDAQEAMIGKLYWIGLGREPLDASANGMVAGQQLDGINWWNENYTGDDLVNAFLNEREFHDKYDGMSNEQYAQAIFDNLNMGNANPVTTVGGQTAADFAADLDSGLITRADVVKQVADSAEAVQLLGQDGQNYLIIGYGDDVAGA